MAKYILRLAYSDHAQPAQYDVSLSKIHEDRPEPFFTPAVREAIRESLQKQSSCSVSDAHLKKIINIWIQDIREGYTESKIKLELPSLLEANLLKIQDQGNQEIPDIIDPDPAEIEPLWGALPPLNFT